MKKYTTIKIVITILITACLSQIIIQRIIHHIQANNTPFYNGLVFHFLLLNIVIATGLDIVLRLRTKKKLKQFIKKQPKKIDLTPLGINEEELVKEVFRIYQKIQVAWMNFDYDTLKKYTTNELYNMYVSQLNTLKVKKQQNMIENIRFYRANIMNYQINHNELETITIQLQVTCKDYLIDQTTGQVVRGNKLNTMNYTYNLTLIRRKQAEMKQCPNCGAALESNMTSQCSYCHSVIVHNKFDWILSKKEMLFQAQL